MKIGMLCPERIKKIRREFNTQRFSLLDVGCGNHYVKICKKWLPNVQYYGVDRVSYNNNEEDFSLMEQFYQKDLEQDSLSDIPDHHFDVIFFNHVIEHLSNGLEVLKELVGKLKPGGKIYVEFPSVNSLAFPKARGTLHFCDDHTHVKIYDIKDVANVLLQNQVRLIKAGKARSRLKVALFPLFGLYQLYSLLRFRQLTVKFGLWDVFGFSHYVFGEKNRGGIQ